MILREKLSISNRLIYRSLGAISCLECRFSCKKYKKRLAFRSGFVYYLAAPTKGAEQESEVSSVVEHILHTDGVISSNLILRISIKALQILDLQGFFVLSVAAVS